jgi:hypothetical protein
MASLSAAATDTTDTTDTMNAAQCAAELAERANEVLYIVRAKLAQVRQALGDASSRRVCVSHPIAGAQTPEEQLTWFYGAKLALCQRGALPAHVDISYNTNKETKDKNGVLLGAALVFVLRGAFPAHPNTALHLVAPGTDGMADMRTLTAVVNTTGRAVRGSEDTSLKSLRKLLVRGRMFAAGVAAELEASPPFAECTQALSAGAAAVVWSSQGVIPLSTKPVTPAQFAKALKLAGVHQFHKFELRLLAGNPSCYCLGARDGEEQAWRDLPEFARAAAHLCPNDMVKGAVVVYFE